MKRSKQSFLVSVFVCVFGTPPGAWVWLGPPQRVPKTARKGDFERKRRARLVSTVAEHLPVFFFLFWFTSRSSPRERQNGNTEDCQAKEDKLVY